MKLKTCKACKCKFTPIRQFQVVCNSYLCAIAYVNLSRASENKKEVSEYQKEKKERLTALKTKSDWLKEAQIVFNSYIRLRDKDLPCISCQRFHSGQYHCGHYRTVGSSPHLRFDEENCSKQCSACNNHLSGNIINYRRNLEQKIGRERLDLLEANNRSKHYSIDDIKDIKLLYKAKIKAMQP